MEQKQADKELEARIRDMMTADVPEPDIVGKKMEDAYKKIREIHVRKRRKLPIAVASSAAAAILLFAMVYCVRHPAFAAQLPLIGHIFSELEGQLSAPGDYSKHSITLSTSTDGKAGDAGSGTAHGTAGTKSGQGNGRTGNTGSGLAEGKNGSAGSGQASGTDNGQDAASYQAKSGSITVTLSEVSYDHNAIYLAMLVHNEEGFAQNARFSDLLPLDYRMKLYQADGSTEDFNYENRPVPSQGCYVEGEFADAHTFKGILWFTGPDLDLSKYNACELSISGFTQELTTGKETTVIVPDYGEVAQMEYDQVHYKGIWDFHLAFDGLAKGKKQEIAVDEVNAQGFGIEKVVKATYEIYAVPILPEGEKDYDYIAVIWDADGKPLEMRSGAGFRMGIYGRDVSQVTVYLLRMQDFLDYKAENAYLQPSKAIYQTTVSFEY